MPDPVLGQKRAQVVAPEAAARDEFRARWEARSQAEVLSGAEFESRKSAEGLYVVSVTGAAREWSDRAIESDPVTRASVKHARFKLAENLEELHTRHGDKLVIAAAAALPGAARLALEEGAERGIRTLGIGAGEPPRRRLPPLDFVIAGGEGSERATLIGVADEVIMIGGDNSARLDALAASAEGRKLSVFLGFGGEADRLSALEVRAMFVVC